LKGSCQLDLRTHDRHSGWIAHVTANGERASVVAGIDGRARVRRGSRRGIGNGWAGRARKNRAPGRYAREQKGE
jgi:hypothetical protein